MLTTTLHHSYEKSNELHDVGRQIIRARVRLGFDDSWQQLLLAEEEEEEEEGGMRSAVR